MLQAAPRRCAPSPWCAPEHGQGVRRLEGAQLAEAAARHVSAVGARRRAVLPGGAGRRAGRQRVGARSGRARAVGSGAPPPSPAPRRAPVPTQPPLRPLCLRAAAQSSGPPPGPSNSSPLPHTKHRRQRAPHRLQQRAIVLVVHAHAVAEGLVHKRDAAALQVAAPVERRVLGRQARVAHEDVARRVLDCGRAGVSMARG